MRTEERMPLPVMYSSMRLSLVLLRRLEDGQVSSCRPMSTRTKASTVTWEGTVRVRCPAPSLWWE